MIDNITKEKMHKLLLKNIKRKLPKLEVLLKKATDHWTYEDGIYRYYHQSFKTYYLQDITMEITDMLVTLCVPNKLCPFPNNSYKKIYNAGTEIKFKHTHNKNWDKYTLPILQAFFHAKFFLEMAVKYGKSLKTAPEILPSGWAALLYFYNLR